MALLVLTNGLQYILCGLHQYIHSVAVQWGCIAEAAQRPLALGRLLCARECL